MNDRTIKRFFPDRYTSVVCQDGSQITDSTVGIEVVLHFRANERHPCCAELISGENYAEIGLSFQDRRLSDYDGVFFLPREVGELLKELGYTVPEEYFK